MRAHQKNAQKYFLRQNKIEKPEMRKILMKTKELSALEVSVSSSHLFSKNQKNAFCMKQFPFVG
jgi:hypothetical protein